MSADYSCIALRRDDGVLFAELRNPPVNLLDARLTRELNRLAKEVATDDAVRVVVFGSADPDFFLAHSDETELLALQASDTPPAQGLGPFHRIMQRIRSLPKITIARIHGIARGGGLEFLLALDMRFASRDSRFALPEVAVGLIPGGGGTQRLTRLVGAARALEMMLGCEDMDAATAERYGLINRTLAPEELDEWVDRFARRVAGFPLASLQAVKAAVVAATALPLEAGLCEEARLFGDLLRDSRTRERVESFFRLGSQDRARQVHDFDEMVKALGRG